MTTTPERCGQQLDPVTAVERRFAVDIVDHDVASSTVVMSMPVAGMANPFTGAPTLGPLAILIDAAAGRSNHLGRDDAEWSVSSELTLELTPSGADADQLVATATPLGREGATAFSVCTLTRGADIIGWGTVRSYFISADRMVPDPPNGSLLAAPSTLAEMMAVRMGSGDDGSRVLIQQPNPGVYNRIGAVHGGVASAGLELAASAAINTDGHQMTTASLRVNFLRPFIAGEDTRYVATPLRIGRTSAVADAQAVGADGRVAVVGRLTAYR
jgi:uncharacterized protein (TIGR00369 family)